MEGFRKCIPSQVQLQLQWRIQSLMPKTQKCDVLALNSGQFMRSTQLIKQNYPVILSQQCSIIVSSETYPFFHLSFVMWICSLMTGIHATSHTISDSLSALFIYFLNHYFHYSYQNVVVLLVVHKGIVCASCGQAVCGIRYKCW